MSLGLIRGAGALALTSEKTDTALSMKRNQDAERLKILMTTTVWAIWKTRNLKTIQGVPVRKSEASRLLIELLTADITNRWNAIKFLSKKQQTRTTRKMIGLWNYEGVARLMLGQEPTFNFLEEV